MSGDNEYDDGDEMKAVASRADEAVQMLKRQSKLMLQIIMHLAMALTMLLAVAMMMAEI